MRVGELAAGDKVIIKNQLFELQKRLNILDLENKLREEENAHLTFSPKIPPYPLDRPGDFLTNVQRNEEARCVARASGTRLLLGSVVHSRAHACASPSAG